MINRNLFHKILLSDFDPMLDGRKEIAKYNKFMDDIFARMNAAIKAKNLDPMDLKLLPNPDKTPRSTSPARLHDVRKVRHILCEAICFSDMKSIQNSIRNSFPIFDEFSY